MARSYAKIATAIWRDEDFRVLTPDEQWTYLLLISQPDISAAGVLTLALARWASRSTGMTRGRLRDALDGLQEHRFVVIDDETDEVLIRSFVRWDGGATNSKRRYSIRDAASQVESMTLRGALATEFQRLDLPAEWIPPSPQVDSPSDALFDSPPDATPASRRVVVTSSSTDVAASHKPQAASRVPSPLADSPDGGRKRAERLPADFAVTPELIAWGYEHTPSVNTRYETAKFVDYWHAKSGKDATKTDWVATWRNWMRKADERAAPGRPTTDDRVAGFVERGRRLQAMQGQSDPADLRELGA